MTTIVTVRTAKNPAVAYTNSHAGFTDNGRELSRVNTSRQEFIPANTTREYYLSDTCHLSVQEAPADAVDLNFGLPSVTSTAGVEV